MQIKKGGKSPVPAARDESREGFHNVREMTSSDTLVGAVIHGRYEILGRIGQGGMAKIYLANDRESGSRVAVKILSDSSDRERGEELTSRLFNEALAAAKINHTNVIEIIDIGTYKDKTFCVMEYLEGRDLSSQLLAKEPMKWERAIHIISQMCDAVEAAHGKNVIHRDLKPENVMLVGPAGEEHVKVLDFGLAKLTDSAANLTRENIILGTPKYMAPEQAWEKDYDYRVDIYALGVIAYELVCGTAPFESGIVDDKARTLQILLMHKKIEPEKPSVRNPALDIPKEAEMAIMRALEKDPAKRFQSALEMKQAMLGITPGRKPADIPASEPSFDFRPVTAPSEAGDMVAPVRHDGSSERMAPWSLPPEEKHFSTALKRFAKRAVIVCMVAAAGFAAYSRRDAIHSYIDGLRKPAQADASAETGAGRPPVQTATVNTSYQSKIESTPRNAAVYNITGGPDQKVFLGRTPLETAFQNYENVLLVSKAGYYSARITITRSQPDQRVNLRPASRQGGALSDDQGAGRIRGAEVAGDDGGNGTAPDPSGMEQ